MGIFGGIVLVVLVIDTVALCGLILIQRGKGGGLAGAFGGGGVEQAFGTRATTLAQKATAVLGGIYLLLSIAARPQPRDGPRERRRDDAEPRSAREHRAGEGAGSAPSVPSIPKDAK